MRALSLGGRARSIQCDLGERVRTRARSDSIVAASVRLARERQAQKSSIRRVAVHCLAHRTLLLASPLQLDRALDRATRVHRFSNHSLGAQFALRV